MKLQIPNEILDEFINAKLESDRLSKVKSENLSRLREVRISMSSKPLSPEEAIELLKEEQEIIRRNDEIDDEFVKLQQVAIDASREIVNAVKGWLEAEGVKVETPLRIALRENLHIEMPNGFIRLIIPNDELG